MNTLSFSARSLSMSMTLLYLGADTDDALCDIKKDAVRVGNGNERRNASRLADKCDSLHRRIAGSYLSYRPRRRNLPLEIRRFSPKWIRIITRG